MNIEIWSLGKENDAFIEDGIQFYMRRLKPLANVQFVLLPPPRRSAATDPEQSKKWEEKTILERLQPHHFLILLDENGRMLSSRDWANAVQQLQNSSVRTLIFLIGGPWGVTEAVRRRAHKVWSLSPLTFPHQLVRLLMAEQLYRSYSILNHSGYHHE